MSITINGTGSITGLTAGGLPDGSITADDIAAGAITAAKLSTGAPSWTSGGDLSFNSGYGSVATAYGCRAWVNFNGTSTVAIRASGNVSSVTDNGTGDYTVNFTTALADANYAAVFSGGNGRITGSGVFFGGTSITAPTASAIRITTFQQSPAQADPADACVAIFR